MVTATAVIALAGCSNPTGGTAAPSGGVASITGSSAPAQSAVDASDPASSEVAPPATTTLTVTATPNQAPVSIAPPPATPPPPAPAPPAPAPAPPAILPTDLSGETHGFVTAVDVGAAQITVDKVDWFTGAAAAEACAEDGVIYTDNNRCTGYYYRNVNPMLRVVAVSPQASIRTLETKGNLVASDLSTLAARVATTQGSSLYVFTVTNGLVTDLQEIYFP